MKFVLCILCLVAVLAVVAADSDAGHFIPKAFYMLDSNGQKSNLHPVNPHTAHYLRRLRRQVQSSSSASSSSSVSTDGGPVYFSSQSISSHTPDVGFARRFGDDVGGGSVGHIVQTTGVIDSNGQVYHNTREEHF